MKLTFSALLICVLGLFGIGCSKNTAPTNQATINTTETYTLSDVQTHNTKDDCWMVINQSIYDVTDYIPQHPGNDRILAGCGTDATGLFTGKSSMGRMHSAMATHLLNKYIIGNLK